MSATGPSAGTAGENANVNTPSAPKTGRVDPLIGTVLAGKYRIQKKIGEGGMGSVYIADQETIDRKVAIKVLLGKLAEDEVAVKRFEQEARAISKMQHPNTVTIYDYGTEGDRLYIVMEFLKGNTLTNVLRQEGVLAPPRACKIMRQVCSSLADAHAAGIIHRDLKPDNIFLTEVGGDPDWVKVLDFGVAKLADTDNGTLTQTGMIFGTPKYMSPEQAEGRPIDYRADIYALGVVLYELLVGRPPFIADTPVSLLLKHISEPPPPFARVRPELNVDPRIEAIVMKALEKVPDRRQQMVGQLAQELASFERAVTGGMFVSGPHLGSTGMVPGLPTEMVGGALPTAGGLVPPSQVPPNLSLSVPSQTRDMAVATGAHTGQATAAGHFPGQNTAPASGVMPFAGVGQGLTHPMAVSGNGVDTLGGVGRPSTGSKSIAIFGGLAVVGLIAAGGVFLSQQSAPLDQPITESPPPMRTVPPADTQVAKPTEQVPPPTETQPIDPIPSTAVTRVEDRPSKRPSGGEETRAASRKVRLTFDSDPSGAIVLLDERQQGITPFQAEFPKDETLTFVFKKDGYEKQWQTIPATSDRVVHAELARVAATAKGPEPERKRPEEPKRPSVPVETMDLDEKVDDLK